ncbi:diacylglycerol/lipid kinase family protein [Cohnella cholangitidis]|uniref:diacylglycerol/lipid kinase family protein n=1 Tax=Cohnella cholangitidis TaxID=2598458 RepID=UPI0015F9A67D|nr:diacylglycerol kinase family protein [Cohnella cholangitidis]
MLLFVINENSGNGRGKKIWATVEQQLRKRGTDYISVIADSESEANIQVSKHLQHGKLKAIAAIGGDGTLHSLLPILAAADLPFGLIPSGSGNDTARSLGIPKDPIQALDIILAGNTHAIDLLETSTDNGHRQLTLTAVAVGLDAAVADDVNKSGYKGWCNKLGLGSLAYVIGLLRALAKYKPRPLTVTIDGTVYEFKMGWLAAISNVSTYGGGLKICPNALPNDGQLHVCIVHSCSVLRMLLIFPTVLFGRHVRHRRFVTIVSGRAVAIQSHVPMLAFGDGEPAGQTPISATLNPRQLDFLIAASG